MGPSGLAKPGEKIAKPMTQKDIDELLEREEVDLVAIARSLIVTPSWPDVMQRGAIHELQPFQRDVLAQLL